MSKVVYKHLANTYGRSPGFWVSFTAEVVRTLIMRVYTVTLIASMVGSITAGNLPEARRYVVLYIIVSMIAILAGSIGDLIGGYSENMVYRNQMSHYYKKLTNKDMSFYRDSHTGYLTSMFRQYLDSSILLARMWRSDVVRVFISLTAPVVVLSFYSWKIGLIALAVVTSQVIYMIWASSKANKYRLMSHEIYRKISGEVADDVTNIVAYKSAGQEESAQKRIMQLRVKETAAFWLRRKSAVFLDFPRSIVTTLLTSCAFIVVLNNTNNTQSSVGLLVLTITYMFQITRNVGDLPDMITRSDDLVTKLEPTLDVLTSQHESILDIDNPKEFSPENASIEIRNLGFRYGDDPNNYIFKNLNISIAAGEHVGIVGLSGAGKSTLASLLMRFDDISEGEITIDGISIKNVAQSNLRQKIAYVPQEPLLFHRSIKENIAYHNHEATEEDIARATEAAHAHGFISKLSNGYETIVGERGVKLSGGQKQRIVIARAVLKNAPIILFDEATSALDSESEHIIQKALPEIIGSHTAIIIAHRLSTVAGLDRIIVMHDGAIEEQGTHAQLLKKKGRYYSLWKKQIGK